MRAKDSDKMEVLIQFRQDDLENIPEKYLGHMTINHEDGTYREYSFYTNKPPEEEIVEIAEQIDVPFRGRTYNNGEFLPIRFVSKAGECNFCYWDDDTGNLMQPCAENGIPLDEHNVADFIGPDEEVRGYMMQENSQDDAPGM